MSHFWQYPSSLQVHAASTSVSIHVPQRDARCQYPWDCWWCPKDPVVGLLLRLQDRVTCDVYIISSFCLLIRSLIETFCAHLVNQSDAICTLKIVVNNKMLSTHWKSAAKDCLHTLSLALFVHSERLLFVYRLVFSFHLYRCLPLAGRLSISPLSIDFICSLVSC